MLKFARRKFLAALAGVWGLSWTEQSDMLNADAEDEPDPGEPRRVYRNTGDIDSNFVAQRRSTHTTVDVVVYPDHYQPVGVELSMDGLQMGAALTSEDAQELGEMLMIAANRVE